MIRDLTATDWTWPIFAVSAALALFGTLGGVSLLRRSAEFDGRVFCWPMPGRTLLGMMFLAGGIWFTNAAFLRVQPWKFGDGEALGAGSFASFVIRSPLIVAVVWVWWRTTHGGLVPGGPSSRPAATVHPRRRAADWGDV